MKKLILLRGNSGSGKTTVARMLQERFGPNTMLISHDMVRMQILHVWSAEGLRRSQPLMIELLKSIPIIMTCLLKRPCSGIRPSRTGMNLARRT